MDKTLTEFEGGPLIVTREPLDETAKDLLLEIVARTARPAEAVESLGYSHRSYAATLKVDPQFADAVAAAMARYVERLEEVADSRAVEGWEEEVYQQGSLAGTIRKYDHTLLIRRLEALAPERYRKNVSVAATVTAGVIVVPAAAKSSEAWADQYGAAEKLP